MILKKFFFSLFLALSSFIFAQTETYPKDYFKSPIDTTLKLAGNFGELRNNHFHAGIDIKTLNQEGLKVYAVADGYVSRIKISAVGYGKALYITHPNGYVSVYAHLSALNGAIADYTKAKHYDLQKFEIDVYPPKDSLKVKQGDVVAFSGNTGGSRGPHLHFEIREEKTEKAINPLHFGFKVSDCKKPYLGNITLFPMDVNAMINGINAPLTVSALKMGTLPIAIVSGNIGLGIETVDSEDKSDHVNGTYSVELYKNKKLIYKHAFDKIGFDETRAINCFWDYAIKRKSGRQIQRSFVVKNNPLHIYSNVVNSGIITINPDSTYYFTYKVQDVCGNYGERTFLIKGGKPLSAPAKFSSNKHVAVFHCQEPNQFKTNDFYLDMPKDILYEDLRFEFSATKSIPAGCFSPVYSVHNDNTPVHTYYTIAIKAPASMSDSAKKKLFISYIDSKGVSSNEGGELKDGFIVTKTRSLGNFVLRIDTTPPTIFAINVKAGKNFSAGQLLRFKSHDALTGIADYDSYIDSKWILTEFDQKRNLLFCEIDNTIQKGPHTFTLLVTDGRGNVKKFKAKIFVR